MASQPFQFKQFSVQQDQCAMKVGTDAVLLGAWAPIHHKPFSVLDIGAGTGILALMLAQRSQAQLIDAIEIDAPAYEQCVTNFEHSDWSDRLFCYHASLQEFAAEIDDTYDLIICNPPFYSKSFKTLNTQRNLARFSDAMPPEQLLESVASLLSKNGKFSIIVPYKNEYTLHQIAKQHHLFPNTILHIKGQPQSPIKRSLITYSKVKTHIETKLLIIETDRHNYTKAYTELTKAFYLKM